MILKFKVKSLTNFASVLSIFQRIERDKELLLKRKKSSDEFFPMGESRKKEKFSAAIKKDRLR